MLEVPGTLMIFAVHADNPYTHQRRTENCGESDMFWRVFCKPCQRPKSCWATHFFLHALQQQACKRPERGERPQVQWSYFACVYIYTQCMCVYIYIHYRCTLGVPLLLKQLAISWGFPSLRLFEISKADCFEIQFFELGYESYPLELPPHPGCQSPPGWHYIFHRESQTKPLYATVTGWEGRSSLSFWSFTSSWSSRYVDNHLIQSWFSPTWNGMGEFQATK